jgi:hypothetical protein
MSDLAYDDDARRSGWIPLPCMHMHGSRNAAALVSRTRLESVCRHARAGRAARAHGGVERSPAVRAALDQWRPTTPTAVDPSGFSLRPRPPPSDHRPTPHRLPIVAAAVRVCDTIMSLLLFILYYYSHTTRVCPLDRVRLFFISNNNT